MVANSPQPIAQPPASGSLVLLSSATVTTAVASLNFFNGFDGTYDELELHAFDVLPTAEAQAWIRCSADGSTFDTGANYDWGYAFSSLTGGTPPPVKWWGSLALRFS